MSGQLKSQSDISDYLAYTVKIAELMETFTWPSVIQYDNEYRKRQFQYGFRWGSGSQHLHSRFLKQRGLAGSQNRGYQAGVKPKSTRNPSTKAVQIKFATVTTQQQAARGLIAVFFTSVTLMGAL